MKFILFGSPIFTRLVLEQLIEADILPLAVVCNPDRPAGRDQAMTPPEIKRYILEKKLPIEVLQPEDPNSIIPHLNELAPDFFLVSAYAKILKPEILAVPKLSIIGIHSSLLPKYRGTSPIQAAILAGDTETGATLYLIDEKMDHGPILAQVVIPIGPEDTHDDLFPKIWQGGGARLAQILPDFVVGKVTPQVQDESQATFTKKLSAPDGEIGSDDFHDALDGNSEKSVSVHRKIRALNPDPGVWTLVTRELHLGRVTVAAGKRLKLLAANLTAGKLVLKRIQIESKTPISL